MANTVNINKAAMAGREERRFGGRFYRAIGLAAIALIVLGLGAGAIISRTNSAAVPAAAPSTASNPYWEYVEDVPIDAPQAVLSNPFAYDPHVYTEWDFREDRRVPATVLSIEEQHFLEQNTQLPDGTLPVPHDSTSDLGTEYDPYVIGSSQPRYIPVQPGTQLPEEASTSGTYRWNFGSGSLPVPPLGPVHAFDWEQQERTQVAPGPVPSATVPIPGSGPCRPGNSECLLDEVFTVGIQPTPPSVYTGICRAGGSDCLPDDDYPVAVTPGSGVAIAPSCIFASSTGAPGEGCNY